LNLKITDAVSVDLRSVWSSGRVDLDAWNGDSRDYGKTQELVAYAGLNFDLLDGRFRNRIGYAHTDTDRRNFNPDNKIQTLTFDAEGQNRRWEYQGVFAVTEALNATFGVEHEKSEMKSRSLGDWNPNAAYGRGEAELNSVYGQIQWTVLDGLTLTGGLRYDDHAQYGDNLLGQVAAAWSLNDGATVLRASSTANTATWTCSRKSPTAGRSASNSACSTAPSSRRPTSSAIATMRSTTATACPATLTRSAASPTAATIRTSRRLRPRASS